MIWTNKKYLLFSHTSWKVRYIVFASYLKNHWSLHLFLCCLLSNKQLRILFSVHLGFIQDIQLIQKLFRIDFLQFFWKEEFNLNKRNQPLISWYYLVSKSLGNPFGKLVVNSIGILLGNLVFVLYMHVLESVLHKLFFWRLWQMTFLDLCNPYIYFLFLCKSSEDQFFSHKVSFLVSENSRQHLNLNTCNRKFCQLLLVKKQSI